ncbi:MAG: hypothetical protein ACOC6Q_02535 [Patescibacteria group bacterium]
MKKWLTEQECPEKEAEKFINNWEASQGYIKVREKAIEEKFVINGVAAATPLLAKT